MREVSPIFSGTKITSADGGISGDARPENVKALIEAVKKYGTYWGRVLSEYTYLFGELF
jgi:hypothetical protein